MRLRHAVRPVLCTALLTYAACGSNSDKNGSPFGPDGQGDGDGDGNVDGGSGSGDGDGNGGGDGCQSVVAKTQRIPPHMLIVLDRSSSMKMNAVNRWDPSVAAVKSITAALQSKAEFGLMAFPSKTVNACGHPAEPDVAIAPNNAGPIATALDTSAMQPPSGARGLAYTPTAQTLESAADLLGDVSSDPDDTVAPRYVLLVTDGAPNCYMDRPPSNGNPVPQSVEGSVNAIGDMAKIGIKTYVIGYDTQSDNTLSGVLDQMASAGGTGDTKHRPVENESGLLDELEEIVLNAVSCTFKLDRAIKDVRKVSVKLDQTDLALNDAAAGWTPSPDGLTVTLNGSSCELLRGTAEHTVQIVETCEIITLE
jgi:hypothetical protein